MFFSVYPVVLKSLKGLPRYMIISDFFTKLSTPGEEIVDQYNPIEVTNRSKRNWLSQMDTANVIEDLGQGIWKKKLEILVSEE